MGMASQRLGERWCYNSGIFVAFKALECKTVVALFKMTQV